MLWKLRSQMVMNLPDSIRLFGRLLMMSLYLILTKMYLQKQLEHDPNNTNLQEHINTL